MLLNGCEKQKFCHVVFLGALKWLTSLFFSCEYKYVELKLYPRIVWFKEQSGNFQRLLKLNIKTFSALFVHALSGLQALVHEEETRNLTLKFLFLVRELVLVNPNNALQECCNPSIFYEHYKLTM